MDFLPAITGAVSALVFGSKRSIAGIIPDVTIEETHTDDMQITDHPVEIGAPISDHAFARPAELTMKVGWTDGTNFINGLLTGSLFNGVTSMGDMYQKFLSMQKNAEVIDISTGKRLYNNMVIKTISLTTDAETENCLVLTMTFRQVFIVQTQATKLKPENQANPEKTAPVQNAGEKKPTLTSILAGGGGVIFGGK